LRISSKLRILVALLLIVVTVALLSLVRLSHGPYRDGYQYLIINTLHYGSRLLPIVVGLDILANLVALPFRMRRPGPALRPTGLAVLGDLLLLVLAWICALALLYGR
jgi:hypothetical protein